MARTTVYNEIVTDEKLNKVNEDNKELLEEFVEYLQSTDKSPLTIKNYISDIQICFCWSLEKNKNKFFIDFTKRDIMKYQNYLLNTLNLSSNRIRRLRSSLSSMSNFIENILDEDYPDFRNIVNKIEAPIKSPVREKTVLNDEQVKYILNYLIEKKEYQKACVFALASCSGSRKSELLRFKTNYFDDKNIICGGSLYKTPEKIKTKGRTSRGKLIYKYVLAHEFKPYLDLWLKEREKLGIDDEMLFVTKQQGEWKPMLISTLDSWAKTFSKILNEDFYFHLLRHYFTTHLSEKNIPDSIIKDIVGWDSLEMVSVYKDIKVDDQLEKYFGEDGIKEVKQSNLSDL